MGDTEIDLRSLLHDRAHDYDVTPSLTARVETRRKALRRRSRALRTTAAVAAVIFVVTAGSLAVQIRQPDQDLQANGEPAGVAESTPSTGPGTSVVPPAPAAPPVQVTFHVPETWITDEPWLICGHARDGVRECVGVNEGGVDGVYMAWHDRVPGEPVEVWVEPGPGMRGVEPILLGTVPADLLDTGSVSIDIEGTTLPPGETDPPPTMTSAQGTGDGPGAGTGGAAAQIEVRVAKAAIPGATQERVDAVAFDADTGLVRISWSGGLPECYPVDRVVFTRVTPRSYSVGVFSGYQVEGSQSGCKTPLVSRETLVAPPAGIPTDSLVSAQP